MKVIYTGHLVYGESLSFRHAWFDGSISITESVREEIVRDFPERTCETISNIVSEQPYMDWDGTKTVACVARLAPVKNHSILLQAWSQLEGREDWALILYGEGELRHELEDMAHRLGIASHVQFAGYSNTITEAVSKAAFCVLPSLIEGQGIVTLEAASVGRPSLVSNVPGSRDCIPDGLSLPNLFDARSPENLAACLDQWMSNPDDLISDGKLMRAFTRETARPAHVADQTYEFYSQCLAPGV